MVLGDLVKRRTGQGGFTLIELVILAGVIAVLAATGMVRLGDSLGQHELDTAAGQLEADLRWMQQSTVNWDYTKALLQFSRKDSKPYGYMIREGTVARKMVYFPGTVKISNNVASFSFSQDGFPAGTLGIGIVLANDSGSSRTVYIDDAGRIRINNP